MNVTEEMKKYEEILRGDVDSKSCLSLGNKIVRKKQPLASASSSNSMSKRH